MAGDERKGWEPQDQEDYSGRGAGRGATTGAGEPLPGGWDHGRPGNGPREPRERDADLLPNGDRASAREGAPSPEETRTGWGGRGEHYPSADGPPGDNRPTGEGGA